MNERSEREREAARLERERRRTAREEQPGPELVLDPIEDDEELDGHRDHDAEEVASGTKRVSRLERAPRAPRPSRPRREPRATQRRQQDGPRRPRRHSLLVRIISLIALALAAFVIWFGVELFQPFTGSGHGSITVTIPPHSGAHQIGNLLAHDGVISSGFFFSLRATLDGDRSNLRSGTFHLKYGMSFGDVLKALTTAPPAAKVSNLTLIEGLNRWQIGGLLHSQRIRGSYLAATRSSKLINPRAYGAPRNTDTLEGFLFPDTYQLRDPITTSALVAAQLTTFRKEFATVNLSYARHHRLTPYDVLIVASIIQAEAGNRHDFPLVASVVYNRLAQGILLGMDATTRYAVGNFTTPLTVSQINSSSPYNTRNHAGLPPTPIDNPGLAAIQAAANPARTNYLYFVVKPCGNGASVFTSSYSQFLRDSAQYQAARAARGGRSPEHC